MIYQVLNRKAKAKKATSTLYRTGGQDQQARIRPEMPNIPNNNKTSPEADTAARAGPGGGGRGGGGGIGIG